MKTGRTKSQLNTKHITPAAESTQASQVSALPLVVGMVNEMSNQVNKEDPSVFKKTNDVKEEDTNSTVNVRKLDAPRDEKDPKKMEQENMRPSLLCGSRQPSRVEKITTPALAEKTFVESVNKGAPVVAQEENYSHIERGPMLTPLESKTQMLNESSADKQPKENVAPPTVAEMVIPTSGIDVEGIPIKPLELKIPIEEEHTLKAQVEGSEAPATLKKEARPQEVPLLESVKQALAASNHNDPAPAQDAPSEEALEHSEPIRDRDPGPGPEVEAPPSVQALVRSEEQHTTSKAINHEPDQNTWKTKLETKALKGTPSPQLEKPDASLVTWKPLFPPESPQVLMKVETSVDEEKSSTVSHQALENSTPNKESAPSCRSQQDQEEPPPSLVGLVQSDEHHKPPTMNPKQDNWRSWKRTLESKVLEVPLTPQVEKTPPPLVPSKALLTSQNPPVPVLVPQPIPDEVAAPTHKTTLREEAANRETMVEESAVEEEATPLVEKEFVAPEFEVVAVVEGVESPVEQEKAIELELKDESEPANVLEEAGGDLAAPIEEAHEEVPVSEESTVVDGKAVAEVEDEDLATSHEKGALLVEEKEFIASEAEAAAPAEAVESLVEQEKAIEWEAEDEIEPATLLGEVGVDVAAPIEEVHEEAPLSDESPVMEEKAVADVEEEDIAPSHAREEAGFEETMAEESAVEEKATLLVEEKQFVVPEVEVAHPTEAVESTVEREKPIDLAADVERKPAHVSEEPGVDLATPVEEAHEKVLLSEESPLVEGKVVVEVEEEIGVHSHVEEEAGFQESAVKEFAVKDKATPLVEEKEFLAPEAEVAALAEVVESLMEEAKAVALEAEVEGEPTTVAEETGVDMAPPIEGTHEETLLLEESPVVEEKAVADMDKEDIAVSHMEEEVAFEETEVEESLVEEKATPLVEEKELVAAEAEVAAAVEATHSLVEHEKAIELEGEVECEPATMAEEAEVEVAAPIDGAHEEALLSEESPVVEEKAVADKKEEDVVVSHLEKEAAFEETAVEESLVEEKATPLVEDKEFVAAEAEAAASAEAMESPVEHEKAIELEGEVEREPATVVEVAASIDGAHEEGSMSEENPVVEKVVPEVEEEDVAVSHVEEEAAFEETAMEKSAMEEEVAPLIEEKEFIALEAEAAASLEAAESLVEHKKAIELEGEVERKTTTVAEGTEVEVAVPIEEAHEESPLLEEKEFIAPEAEAEALAGAKESPFEQKEAIDLNAEVEGEPTTAVEEAGVEVGAPIVEAHEEALLSEESPGVEDKSISDTEEVNVVVSHVKEEAAFEETVVDESGVEEEAITLVEEEEFVAGEAEAAASVEAAESPDEHEGAIELKAEVESEPAIVVEETGVEVAAPIEEAHEEAPLLEESPVVEESPIVEEKAVPEVEDANVAVSHVEEEAAIEETAVEESAVEEATPLVEEKESVASKTEAAASTEVAENPMEEAKAIKFEAQVEREPAKVVEYGRVDVAAPIEGAHKEAPKAEERPIVEDKSIADMDEEDVAVSHVEEEATFEETAVEDSVAKEEAVALVDEEEFVAPETEVVASMEGVESPVEHEKAIKLEGEVEREPATVVEEAGVEVGAPIVEAHKETPLSEESPGVEDKSIADMEEVKIAASHMKEEAVFEETVMDGSAVEEEANPLVEEEEFVTREAEAAASTEAAGSPDEHEKAIELKAEVEGKPATVAEEAGVEVAAFIEDALEETPMSEESPVVEEKVVRKVEEEAAFKETTVEESAVEEEASTLVEENEFAAPEVEAASLVEATQSPVKHEKGIELEAEVEHEPATVVDEAGVKMAAPIDGAHEEALMSEESLVVEEKWNPDMEEEEHVVVSHVEEEDAFEKTAVEESGVEEGPTPLVVEKEFNALEAEAAALVEAIESPVEHEKAIELEAEVESMLATLAEEVGVDVVAPIEGVHIEAPMLEETPVVEEKSNPDMEKEEHVAGSHVEEEVAFEETAEGESLVEEKTPLVEEEEFVTPEAEAAALAEATENPVEHKKAIALEAEVERELAKVVEDAEVDVAAPIEGAHKEAAMLERGPVVEKSIADMEEADAAVLHVEDGIALEETAMEECELEEEATTFVAKEEIVALEAKAEAEAATSAMATESPVEHKKAIELDAEVEREPAKVLEDARVDVAAPIEGVHEEAPLLEETPEAKEKLIEDMEEDVRALSYVEEEAAFQEIVVEESGVEEEPTALVEEKEVVAPEEEVAGVEVAAPIEEAHEEAPLAEESTIVVEGKSNLHMEDEDVVVSHVEEEAASEETTVEEFEVEEKAPPLVEEKEFVTPEAEDVASVEATESPIKHEKAIELETEVGSEPAKVEEEVGVEVAATIEGVHGEAPMLKESPGVEEKLIADMEEEDVAVLHEEDEVAFEETAVEESLVGEKATPLVEEKEFVAPEAEVVASVEAVESLEDHKKAIELEAEVERGLAKMVEDARMDVALAIEGVHEEAPFSEESPVVEEKVVADMEEEDVAVSHVEEEPAFEETAVEESLVEEKAAPLVEEKEFVAPVAEAVALAEAAKSPVEHEKAIDLEAEVESEPSTVVEEARLDVAPPIEGVHEEATLLEESPVVEEKLNPDMEEEDVVVSHVEEEPAFKEIAVQESAAEEEATPLVEEKEFVGLEVEATTSADAADCPVEHEKAIKLEAEVERGLAKVVQDARMDVAAPIEEAHEEALLSEESPVVERKAVADMEEEDVVVSHMEEEPAFEETAVEESLVEEEAAFEETAVEESLVEEEAAPLVEEKEFVAPVGEAAALAEVGESPVEHEKAIELEGEPATVAEEAGVEVAAPIESVHEEAPTLEESPVMEEKSIVDMEEEDVAVSHAEEGAAFEKTAVEEFAVEEATPLVEVKEFIALEAEAAASVEATESPVMHEKAIELKAEVKSEPATVAEETGVEVAAPIEEAHEEPLLLEESSVVEEKAVPKVEEDIALSHVEEGAGFQEIVVEESAMEEEAPPLVEEEFVAPEAEAAASAEATESSVEHEKGIELEAEVESEPATVAEEFGVDVTAPIEGAHEEAPMLEESPVVEEKSVADMKEEDVAVSHVEEAAFEETAVEESAVEKEASPLVELKEFNAPEVEAAATLDVVESPIDEGEGIELDRTLEAALATEEEVSGLDVAAAIVEASIKEEKAMDVEKDVDIARRIPGAGLVEFVGPIADGYVEDPLVVWEYGIGLTGVVDDYFPGNIVRLRKNSEEASVDVHSWVPELVGALSVPIVYENGAQVGSLIGNDIGISGVTGLSPVIELRGTKKKSDEVSVDVNLEICEDDGGARPNPITGKCGFASEVDGFDLGHIGYSGADLSEKTVSEPFEHIEGTGVDIDNMSTLRAAEDKEAVIHGCAKDSIEGSEWELVAPPLVEVPNSTGNAVKARQDNEENVHLTIESPSHGTEESSALATGWELVAEELQDTHVMSDGPGVQSSPFERVKESTASSDWEMVPTGSGAKDENFAEYIEMTKESAEMPTTEEDDIADVPIGGEERVLNNTSEEKQPTFTRGLMDRETPLIKVVQNKDQETEDVTVDVGVSKRESPLENLQEVNEFSIKSHFNLEHFKKRPLGVATRTLKHVIQEPKVEVHKAVLHTWPPSPITSEEDNTRVDIDHENAPVVESRQVPSAVDVGILEEPSVATTGENMEVSEDPHTPKNDEQEETNLSSEHSNLFKLQNLVFASYNIWPSSYLEDLHRLT